MIASAFEAEGFEALEKPFKMTAEYSGMKYTSLIVPDASVSGDIIKVPGIREKARLFGKTIS